MVTLEEMDFALIRTFVRQNEFKPIVVSKDELENKISFIFAEKTDNEDGSITVKFREER